MVSIVAFKLPGFKPLIFVIVILNTSVTVSVIFTCVILIWFNFFFQI